MSDALPPWVQALESACSPLVRACRPALAPTFPRGVEALKQIGASIEEFVFREHASEEEERTFVERTGALLALVLIDHVGDGAYVSRNGVSRARLKTRAFFDPFSVIDAALDAEKPQRFLAEVVGKLEAEANDEGPLSRVLWSFENTLAHVRPDLNIEDRFECTIRLQDGTVIDLQRAVEATRDQGMSAVAQATAKLVGMLPGGDGERGVPWSEAKARILPRLVAKDFNPSADKKVHSLFLAPVVGDIALAFVLMYDGKARYVRTDELTSWEVSADAAKEAAVANLAARSANARFAHVDTQEGACIIARSGDGLDSARLLLPGLHDVLAKELGPTVYLAVPHRDTLQACANTSDALKKAFHARAKQDAARAPHRISEKLYILDATGLREDPAT
ncbi:MAG: hypothetical protein IPK60_05825 [Sandaracinaceae bacterium]|nr:hypothetical protein [Sandaracinaceae bacterium]